MGLGVSNVIGFAFLTVDLRNSLHDSQTQNVKKQVAENYVLYQNYANFELVA